MIDTHIHFYNTSNGITEWIKNTQLPDKVELSDLPRLVDKFVHIEAHDNGKNPFIEIDWVSSKVGQSDKVSIIANIDFTLNFKDFIAYVNQFKKLTQVVGFRQIQAYHPASNYQPYQQDIPLDLQDKLKLLADYGYIYEAQMYPEQYLKHIDVINQSSVMVAVEHMGLPMVRNTSSFAHWNTLVNEIGTLDKWYLKLSGFELVNDRSENIENILDLIFANIPSSRLCYGSNHPVSHQDNYGYWQQVLETYAPHTMYDDIFDVTAQALYFGEPK